ncbi:flavin reductase family protein [Devosia sp. 63-57]|uniref:flavin reductase family protein n=1 Tax=Devosia sp. 63-57 TaxID=1895751 RepID=UPI000B1184AF|nr:flavin reductase family protein [Devosia sp. 63-57]
MSIVDIANFLPANKPAVDVSAFKLAMRNLAGAVSVITVGNGPQRTGFTATSVSSFSVDPPVILVSLNKASSSWQVLRETTSFAVNILTEAQSGVADRFAGRGGIKGNDRYVGWDWDQLDSGVLGLSAALAVLDCDVDEIIERHSHALVFGRVRSADVADRQSPLLYWNGQYQQLLPNRDPFSA